MSNLPLRLASLGMAALLWFAIAAEKTSEMGVMVPVELQNMPRDLEVTGDAVNAVEVRLRASPGVIQRLAPGEVSAQIDLTGVPEGERIVHLSSSAIRVPFGVRVVKINPSSLTLNLEHTLQKVVPVRPRLLGRPARGSEVAEVVSDPAEVRIAGPKSRVQEIESAFTEPLSLENAKSDVSDVVTIGLEDPALRILDDTRARVVARIREVREERTLTDRPVEPRGAEGACRPAAVSVVVRGPASLLARLAADDVRPYVEAGALAGPRRLTVAVELAAGLTGVEVVRVDPAEVTLRPKGRR